MGTIERVLSTMVLTTLCGGCSPGSEATAETAGRLVTANGVSFNGVSFNGVSFNGVSFNGVRLGALPFTGFSSGGHLLTEVTLEGTSFAGILPNGKRLSGRDLIGAELDEVLSDGAAATLRIDDMVPGEASDVLRYSVSMRPGGVGAPVPLCRAIDGTPVLAIPLVGSWDESSGTSSGGAHLDDRATFTFACEGYALAKCVELGYAPWRTLTECKAPGRCATRSLAPLHEACTRMLRADYCGDGTPTTRDGTRVDVWDHFGLQEDDQPTWSLEAEWSPGGAVCVERTRWTSLPGGGDVAAYIHEHCPERWETPGCGGDASTFFTATGFDVPLASRVLLRSRIDEH